MRAIYVAAGFSGAVSIECGGAVWADDAEILYPIVRRGAICVVEDEGHSASSPRLSLAAQFAKA